MENALGLPEFKISPKPHEDNAGLALRYDAEKEGRPTECPRCQTSGPFYSNGPGEPRLVQDIPSHKKWVYINIKVRRWKCRECGYVFTDFLESVDGKEQMTRRLRDLIRERSTQESFSKIGREYNVSEGTVRGIFRELVEEHEKELAYKAPRVLGIDEAHLDSKLRTVITDSQKHRLLDIVPHRNSPKLIAFLKKMEGANYVKVVTMDMYEGFRSIVHKALPHAHIVVDHFHVIQLANRKMDAVRLELKRNLISLEERLTIKALDPETPLTESEIGALQFAKDSLLRLKGTAKLFTTNREDMTAHQRAKIMFIFQFHPELKMAFYLKECIRRMYASKFRREAGYIYLVFKKNVPDYMEPFKQLERDIDSWAREIFNFFYFRFSNGFAENRNRMIKRVQSDGRALSFEQMRYKVLFESRAAKPAKFNKRKAEWFESASFGNMMASYSATVEELVEGFYVDMAEYMDS